MGFTRNVATTTDAMLYQYGFEQEFENKLREAGKTDFSDVHKGVINRLIVDLKMNGIDPAQIVNTEDFEAEICFLVLAIIYLGDAGAVLPSGKTKSDVYMQQYMFASSKRIVQFSDGTEVVVGAEAKRLPMGSNQDQSAFIRGMHNLGENQHGALSGDDFRDAMRQRPLNGYSTEGYLPPNFPGW